MLCKKGVILLHKLRVRVDAEVGLLVDIIRIKGRSVTAGCNDYVHILLQRFSFTMLRSISRLRTVVKSPVSWKRYAHAPVALNWEDPLDSASLFTPEELAIQETARSYCQERLLPRVLSISFRSGFLFPLQQATFS